MDGITHENDYKPLERSVNAVGFIIFLHLHTFGFHPSVELMWGWGCYIGGFIYILFIYTTTTITISYTTTI